MLSNTTPIQRSLLHTSQTLVRSSKTDSWQLYLSSTVLLPLYTVVDQKKGIESGVWDTINFVNVKFSNDGGLKATYKLTSTVILQMSLSHNICGAVDLSGSITKQIESTVPIKSPQDHQAHVENVGRLVEDIETTLRNQVEEIYFKKSQEVLLIYSDNRLC